MVSLIFNNGLTPIFRASDDCDRLSCLCSMWLYSLINQPIRLSFCLGLFFGWAVGCPMLAIAIISERYKGKERVQTPYSWFCRGCWDGCFNLWSQLLWSALAGRLPSFTASVSILLLYLICALRSKLWRKTRDVKMTGTMATALGLVVVAAAIVRPRHDHRSIPSVVELVSMAPPKLLGLY